MRKTACRLLDHGPIGVMMLDQELPGIARIRARFLELLIERQLGLQVCADTLRRSDPGRIQHAALRDCQAILHKIAGTAGIVGFAKMGNDARSCEDAIIGHLTSGLPDAAALLSLLDDFQRELATAR